MRKLDGPIFHTYISDGLAGTQKIGFRVLTSRKQPEKWVERKLCPIHYSLKLSKPEFQIPDPITNIYVYWYVNMCKDSGCWMGMLLHILRNIVVPEEDNL